MNQKSAYLISQTRQNYCLLVALSIVFMINDNHLLSFNFLVSEARAQTEFEIKTNESNLEQEYRDELDKWMLLAYEGDTEAQFKVGVLFTNDQFNQPDFEQAVYWYKQAARQGHILAQYNLGHQYLMGVGVRKNELTAMQWWQKAAESDHALAQFNIGRAYFLGIGFEKDQALSKYWFKRAAYNKEPKSIEILQELGWSDGEMATKPSKPKTTNAKKVSTEPENVAITKTNQKRIESGWITRNKPSNKPASQSLSSRITPITNTGVSNKESGNDSKITSKSNPPIVTKQNRPIIKNTKSKQPDPVITSSITKPQSQTSSQPSTVANTPVGLYTDPEIRSILIAVINNRENLTVLNSKAGWSEVNSKIGFPVWIHGDFLNVSNNRGTITGEAVNARSVPIITKGTIVGSFNQNEKVKILTKKGDWYRIISPLRFKAWAKTDDLNQTKNTIIAANKQTIVENNLTEKNQLSDVEIKTINIDSKPPIVDIPIIAKPLATKDDNFSSDQNVWLFSQAADSYTLQLASFDSLSKEQEFLASAKRVKRSNLHKFVVESDDANWTYLLYGSYTTIKKAEKAKSKIKQKLAWPRTFGKIQQNRCLAWSKKSPRPNEYREYCSL